MLFHFRQTLLLPLGGPGEAARKAPEADIQLFYLGSVGDGTGNFCEWAGNCRGRGGGRPSEGLRLDPTGPLRGWTKDALNLAKSGCKVAVNSR